AAMLQREEREIVQRDQRIRVVPPSRSGGPAQCRQQPNVVDGAVDVGEQPPHGIGRDGGQMPCAAGARRRRWSRDDVHLTWERLQTTDQIGPVRNKKRARRQKALWRALMDEGEILESCDVPLHGKWLARFVRQIVAKAVRYCRVSSRGG